MKRAGAILLLITILLQTLARTTASFATWYVHNIYIILVGIIGRISGMFSYSVVETLLYVLICGGIAYIIKFYDRPLKLLQGTALTAIVLFFLYTVNCGINYYATPFSEYAGLTVEEHSTQDLVDLCQYLVEKVNKTYNEDTYVENKYEWKQAAVIAMESLGEEYAGLDGYYPRPKEITISEILSVQQLCGVYSPFTIEANFNGDMTDYNIPHTMCHELSHLKGFMREDEANFIGYLACIQSEHPAFQYSGYLTGWVYAGNQLAKADMDAYIELSAQMDPRAKEDLQDNNEYWDQYEGKVAEASNQMNDTYLKMNSQSDGVQSYGRMVDLMLSDYCRNK